MEGLEITEILCSEAFSSDPTGRLDASFFEKRFINLRQLIKKWKRLDSYAKSIICGPFGSNLLNDNYVEQGIPMIRPFNLRDCRADAGDIALLDNFFVEEAKLKVFGAGTLMFARVGEIGAGINLYDKATISPNIIAAELGSKINPFFVSIFTNTKYGREQLESGMKVVAQPTISTDSIRALRIPPLSQNFQQKIADFFQKVTHLKDQSVIFLANAEAVMLKALGLNNWTPPEALSYIRPSSEAFAAGRLDAEYFHPAKAKALAELWIMSDVCVGDLFNSVRDLWQPAPTSLMAVRNHDLTDALDPFLDPTKPTTLSSGIASTKKRVVAGDLVVSRLRSYLREVAIVLPGEGTETVVSTEFIVLRPKAPAILAVEVLLLYLRSILPQTVFKWSQDGSNHPRFDEKELLNLPVPRALISEQRNYVNTVQQIIEFRQQASHLLDAARRAVEIAIEDSEAAALAYLAKQSPQEN